MRVEYAYDFLYRVIYFWGRKWRQVVAVYVDSLV